MRKMWGKVLRSPWAAGMSVAVASGLLLVVLVSPKLLPYSMDEFIGYQQLGCILHPDKVEGILETAKTEGCAKYDTRLPKTAHWLPTRAYGYVGSLPGLVYAPFFFLIRSPISARLQGLVFFVLAAFLMAQLLRLRVRYVFLAAFLFPLYFFSFIIDTGPIGFQVILLLAMLLLVRRAHEQKLQIDRNKLLVLVGFLGFLGFWIKPNFSWLLPIPVLYILLRPYIRGGNLKNSVISTWKYLVPFAVGLVPPTFALLGTIDRGGKFYAQYIALLNLHVHNIHEFIFNFKRLSGLFLQGNRISSVAITLPHRLSDIIPFLLLLGIAGWWFAGKPKDKRPLLLAACALLVFFTEIVSYAAATHHIVLVFVFVVMALSYMLKNIGLRPLAVIGLLLGSYWLYLFIRLPQAAIYRGATAGKDHVLAQVWRDNKAPTTAQINFNWGTYYISNLFSANGQKVLYYDIEDRRLNVMAPALTELKGVDKVVVITSDPSRERVQAGLSALYGQPLKTYQDDNWSAYVYKLPR